MTTNPLIHDLVTNHTAPMAEVPEGIKHKKRAPFIFLVDNSHSTGDGDVHADIHVINEILSQLFDKLKNPPPSSPLFDKKDIIDVAVISYSNEPREEVPWALVDQLPVSMDLEARQGTATGLALQYAMAYMKRRLENFRDEKNLIPVFVPHIFHITDGAPNDMVVGSQPWKDVGQQLIQFDGATDPERRRLEIIHLVSPRGCHITGYSPRDINDKQITGEEAMAQLTGRHTVWKLELGPDNIDKIVNLVTVMMDNNSRVGGKTAIDTAKEVAKQDKVIVPTTF